ncbi:MAG: LexA family transcriptional regulator [Clostridiales bacterium]|nr:LexA family transcriptional regulator [Clostridiales bacterium]
MSTSVNSLTAKQKKVYTAIETYILLKGIPPTVREIGEMVGEKTPGAVQGILGRLEKKGVIKRQNGAARSIQLISFDGQMYSASVFLPEIKKITRRNIDDLTNFYNINKYQPIPVTLLDDPKSTFILKCTDISLEESGIKQGDLLFINQKAEIKSGDIVLIFYENFALLRYIFFGEDPEALELKADTDLIGKESFRREEVRIIGKLCGRFTKT